MAQLTARTATIFIAVGDSTSVYRSIQEVPQSLRAKLQHSTRGVNSATILIADKRGREELIRALQGQPTDVQCRLADVLRTRNPQQQKRQTKSLPLRSLRTWLEFLLPIAVGASLWLFVESRY
jgi:hypothetical protein